MNELKSTYALLFGEREKETGEVEAVRKALTGDHSMPKWYHAPRKH